MAAPTKATSQSNRKKDNQMTSNRERKINSRQTRWSARQLATMALFVALGIILSFIEFPLLPGTDFLKFDASSVTAMTIGFSFGPAAGCLVGVLVAWIHGLFSGNLWGALMNSVVVLAFVLPAAVAYKRNGGTASTVVGLVISCICMVAVAIIMNLVITPIYMGVPVEAVMAMILPILLPFNILKAVINAVLSFVLLRSLRTFLHG
jgi:ECF transporter S component (folate family)